MYANAAGATMYNPMLSAITDTPNTNNSNSEPLSARVIIESEEIIWGNEQFHCFFKCRILSLPIRNC